MQQTILKDHAYDSLGYPLSGIEALDQNRSLRPKNVRVRMTGFCVLWQS